MSDSRIARHSLANIFRRMRLSITYLTADQTASLYYEIAMLHGLTRYTAGIDIEDRTIASYPRVSSLRAPAQQIGSSLDCIYRDRPELVIITWYETLLQCAAHGVADELTWNYAIFTLMPSRVYTLVCMAEYNRTLEATRSDILFYFVRHLPVIRSALSVFRLRRWRHRSS